MSREFQRARIVAAFDLAFELHSTQTRKRSAGEDRQGIPYVAHLLSVAALVLEHGGSEDEVIAALLHDGPEDQGGRLTLEAITLRFGTEVGAIVHGCSDTLEQRKPAWLPRKKAYLEHLAESDSDSLLLVSLADKVHNLRSILSDYSRLGSRVWERFNQGRNGTLWYYGELLTVYRQRATERCRPLLEDYESLLSRLEVEVESREGVLPDGWSRFGR